MIYICALFNRKNQIMPKKTTPDTKVQDIITNVFSLIQVHGEDYVNAFIKNLVDSCVADEFIIADYIIHKVRSHYKLSQKSLLSNSCRGVIREAKIVMIGAIDGIINITTPQMIELLNISNSKALYRLRKEVFNLSDKVKHERDMINLIAETALSTKEKFNIE